MSCFRRAALERLGQITVLAALLTGAGCTTQVKTTGGSAGPSASSAAIKAPRPARVLVYPFILDSRTVALDSSVLARRQAAASGSDPANTRANLASEITGTISRTLVDKINAMGLTAVAVPLGTKPNPGDVMIQGQIARADAGNEARRMVVGFGAGKSEVSTDVQVLLASAHGSPALLQSYDAQTTSGRAPGMGVGVAADRAALAVGAAVTGEQVGKRGDLTTEARKQAENLADNIKDLFVKEGWVQPD